jgi:hypothetical protein
MHSAARDRARDRVTVWGLRLLLGAALAFFSEIVWWSNDPLTYDVREWLVLAAIYTALAGLMLDFMARFRVGDGLGLLVVAGVYGLLNGSLIAHSAFTHLPISLVSRPLGLHTLGGGLLALLFLGWLLDGRGPVWWRVVALVVIGLLWGIWVHWFPLLDTNRFVVPSLGTALALVAGGLAVLGLLLVVMRGRSVESVEAFRLGWWEWIIVGGVLGAAFLFGAAVGAIGRQDGTILGALFGYLIVLLYFQRGQRRESLLRRVLSVRPIGLAGYAVYAVAMMLPAVVGYTLPGESPDGLPMQALTAAFTAFGVVWLPGVSLAMGLRTYARLLREEG